MNWNLYTNFFVAILAIINPLTILVIWSELTNDVKRPVRYRTAGFLLSFALVALTTFLIGGKYILNFFSIDLMVFKVAGGILLLLSGIKMIEGLDVKTKDADDNEGTVLQLAKLKFQKIIVPMAIPVLVGPGSITTMFLFGVGIENWLDYGMLSVILAVYFGILLVVLASTSWIETKIDNVVFTAVTRLLGIIVVAIALQFILEGLGEIFPTWIDSSSPVHKSNSPQPIPDAK